MNQSNIVESPLLTPWGDPVSGVKSLILTQRVAAVQTSFYFVNSSFTNDGRFLWFYCSFPPSKGPQLGVVDFEEQSVRYYPETQFLDASPYVDKSTGEVYWATGLEIWKRGPRPGDQAGRVAVFPDNLACNRQPWRLATHLTLSADRKAFAIDAQIGSEWFLGDLPVDGTTPFRLWQRFDDCCYNHTQFSPVDPDLLLTAQDGWNDPSTGKPGKTQDRLWVLRRGEKARPLCPDAPLSSDWRGHEWWDSDGMHVWYVDYRKGTEKVNILTGKRTSVWANGHTHSHCDREGQYLVGDINPRHIHPDRWRLAFYNIKTGKEISIVTTLPPPSSHNHPHPQFCMNDRYICYTTTVRGSVDVALVPVEELVARTS